MSNRHLARRALFAAAVSLSTFTAAHAGDRFPRPGSLAAIQSVKDPAHYGSHPPAADQAEACAMPGPGALQSLLAAKDPSRFGPRLAAADLPPRYAPPGPGSLQALLAAKDPARFASAAPPAAFTDFAALTAASGAMPSRCG